MLRTFSFSFVALALLAAPATAAGLRATVTVDGPIVTIGDFFTDAGDLAGHPLFRSPDLGVNGAIPPADVIRMASEAGLANITSTVTGPISVHRLARAIDAEEQRALVQTAIAEADHVAPEGFRIRFFVPPAPIYVDPHLASPLRLVSLSSAATGGHFEAVYSIERDGGATDNLTLTGEMTLVREVVTLTHAIPRGAVISASDVTRAMVDATRISGDAIVNPDDIVGEEAKKALRAGEALSAIDFAPQQMVKRGDLVTVIFRHGGMTLQTRARAQQNGALGEVVDALNEQSARVIQGTVSGPGEILIDGGPNKLATR